MQAVISLCSWFGHPHPPTSLDWLPPFVGGSGWDILVTGFTSSRLEETSISLEASMWAFVCKGWWWCQDPIGIHLRTYHVTFQLSPSVSGGYRSFIVFQCIWPNIFEHSQFWRCWRKTLLSRGLKSEKVKKSLSWLGLVFQCQLDIFGLDLLEGMVKFAEFVPYFGPLIALANIYGIFCMKHYARPRNANV